MSAKSQPTDHKGASQDSSVDSGVGTLDLHQATLFVFSDLSWDGVLSRITQASKNLVQARYAALVIWDGKGGVGTLIYEGFSEQEIKHLPQSLIEARPVEEIKRTGKSIRVSRICDHPEMLNLPEGFPPIESLLGIPIMSYRRQLGQIYLADKIGSSSFSEGDQHLIEIFSAQAAVAIENAHLYKQALLRETELIQRNEELGLINSLTGVVSSSMELSALLSEMLNRILSLFEAEEGEVFLAEKTTGFFNRFFHDAPMEHQLWKIKRFSRGEGFLDQIAQTAELAWTHNLADEPSLAQDVVESAGYGTLVGVPLLAHANVVGILSLAFIGERKISDREIGLLKAVGDGVGIAIMIARLNRQARRLAILEERDRIGMDLHDGIIQSIYAVGLTMDCARMMVDEEPSQASERLLEAIDGLNAVIADIRTFILDLQPSRMQVSDIRKGLQLLIREFKANSPIDAKLLVEDDAILIVDSETATSLYLIAQEALSNVAKHAHASRVWISLRKLDEHISLQIIDNGTGFNIKSEPNRLGHGMNNMAERARQIRGELEVLSSLGEGTTITVLVEANSEYSVSESINNPSTEASALPL